ncbi:ATP-dependent hsl protease ATP-binding subunit hslU [Alkalidesulfovibrio alkalitolerans DSM 16529]|uniref:ATP-dependent protease ATPase subunit HslU n=1 Tax=Alkalidesulfovibrio alkalitolerans DSM 16529 TaxID=1121439 RepID=S7T4S3_9BACT|nr:ATP-dependent protease ATPase subunit HslU [Alkalidesulfovibrio alkalitolerans]EPR31490.1 ATP-dependent hsl protease ATP-binding subunit hslU [Alkalidesulfovibrio alkalitolerans DSM 16529]
MHIKSSLGSALSRGVAEYQETATSLTPREIVSELDRHVIGQAEAKRMVAIAMRNRWRRMRIDPNLRDEIAPKNIIMMGPTGVGKTEIARRLAKLSRSPFFKVEATKFTEVGYVGRDVESMVRDLMEIGVNMVKKEEAAKVKVLAEKHAEDLLLDLLLPGSRPPESPSGESAPIDPASTREKFRKMWREGRLDEREVELDVSVQGGPQLEILSMPGMEDMGSQIRDMLSQAFPQKKKRRRVKVREAYDLLVQQENEKLVDMDKVMETARLRVEQSGILFIDEIDKICSGESKRQGGDVSREGVQRDLLPVVEGCVVNTKYGMIKTDHILFIAAGAFHTAKPSDLIPELQGRFPLRVELTDLGAEDFYRILTEPRAALTVQYVALLATEGLSIEFDDEALREIAEIAEEINRETENIGARRLYTIMERLLTDLSFEAPDRSGQQVRIDRDYVRKTLADFREDRDLSRYIL